MSTTWKILRSIFALSLVILFGVILFTDPTPATIVLTSNTDVRAAEGAAVADFNDDDLPPGVKDVYVGEVSVPVLSPAVRDLPSYEPGAPLLDREMAQRDYFGFVGDGVQGPPWLDPLVALQNSVQTPGINAFSTPLTNWAGMDYNSGPPDTTGDVGPTHFVQSVNGPDGSTVQVFNKSTGAVMATFAMSDLAPVGSACATGYCDPIVIYDSMADRWLIAEFSGSSSYPYCIYVSKTGDPTGAWWYYTWDLPYYDYPKYGVWPDAYYMGYNGGTTGYRQVFAFDRAKMLAGQPATYQMFSVPSLSVLSFQLLVPASWEGTTPPPAGTPGLFMRPRDTEVSGPTGYATTDFLDMYAFHVDWVNSANSTLTELPRVPIAEYDCTLCGTGSDWSCMPQPGTTQALDPIREPLHQPLQYRNWGTYETLVGGFAEDVNSADMAAVRWFELRKVGGVWSAYQEGVVGGGDTHHRSVTSVAMDGAGGMGLGYTLTSSSVYPSIRYGGRRSWDTLGTMAYVDIVAQAGTGSQTTHERWGDYAGIGVDPADDCTFWFTTEYMLGTTSATRVISFRHDADFFPDASPGTIETCGSPSAAYTVNVAKTCALTGAVTMSVSGLPGGATSSWSTNPVTPVGSTTLTVGNLGSVADGTYNLTITGISGAITRQDTVTLNVTSGGSLTELATLSTPGDGAIGVTTSPTLVWTAVTGATSYEIQVATDPGFTTIVRSATGLAGTSYAPSPALSQGTVYYWRVRASNACGAGSYSQTSAFQTVISSCTVYTSTDVPQTISNKSHVYSDLTVADAFSITDVNVIIGQITHPSDGDLDIYIIHPDSTQVELSTDNGGTGDNYTNTIFDDEAGSLITAGTAPFTGSFRPEVSLTNLDGRTSAGLWQLHIYDDTSPNTGSLSSWSLELCRAPLAADYSDSPSSYGAAWHSGTGALKLGATWDSDTVFTADSDDSSDDGITFLTALEAGQSATVRANVQGTPASGRWLKLWFDWDGDGIFESSEKVHDAAVASGDNDIIFTLPGTLPGIIVYRARLFDSASSPTTEAMDAATGGEVEDGWLTASTITFSPDPLTINGCESVQVSVMANDVSNLYGADIQISFDPAVLEVVDADPGTAGIQVAAGGFLQGTLSVSYNTADNSAGTIRYAASQTSPTAPVSGSGALFVITFRAKSAAVGSGLMFTATQLQNQASVRIPAAAINSATSTVAPAAPALSITQLDATNVRLSWGGVAGATSYNLYMDTVDPYFTPGAAYQSTAGVQIDDAALGDVNTNHFYVARAACATGFASDISNRVGEIEFEIVRNAYNVIALPLMDGRYGYGDDLGYAVDAVEVSQWDASIQAFNTRVVGDWGDDFALATGSGYFVYTPGSGATIFANVGGVSNVSFAITRGSGVCQLNLVSVPLNEVSLTAADVLAGDIGGVPEINEWMAAISAFNLWSGWEDPFPTRIGYPYWPCADTSGGGSTWP